MHGVITSIKDEHLAQVRALANREGRSRSGGCLLEGATLIGQALETGATLRFAIHAEGETDPVTERLAGAGVPVRTAKESVLRQALRLARPVRWVAVAELEVENDPDAPYGDMAVVLDGVADPGNLGTIVRTAVGLGVMDVVCTDEDTDLTSRRVLDASRAAVLRARIRRAESPADAVRELHRLGFEVVATASSGSTAQALTPLRGGPVAVVVGNETSGVSDAVLEAADHLVRIPMAGDMESLNVAVATGISLYELRTRAVLAALTDRANAALLRELAVTLDALRHALDSALRPLDHADAADVAALLTLQAEPDLGIAELAGRLDRTEDETGDLVERLNQADRLSGHRVTESGRAVLAALWSPYQETERKALAGFTAAERDQFRAALHRIRDNCRGGTDHSAGNTSSSR